MGSVKDIFDIIKELTLDIKQMVDKVAANELISKLIEMLNARRCLYIKTINY